MKTAAEVNDLIKALKNKGIPLQDVAWQTALACVGWAYVWGAYGEYCDPSNRRSRAREDHPTIKSKCKNFNGKDTVPAGCVGCQWFLGTAESDAETHEGRTRFFDCRGFVYWILHQVYGFWDRCPAGATTMWNTESNWSAKGLVKDGVPENTLVCLFYPDKNNSKKMAHIGFGYNGETVEASVGVEHHTSYAKKWTHWAVPACVEGGTVPVPAPDVQSVPDPVPDKGYAVVTGKNVAIRKGPTTDASVITRVPTGKQVKVETPPSDWEYVSYNGVKGYMMKEFLKEG